jgi:hypothetical protein
MSKNYVFADVHGAIRQSFIGLADEWDATAFATARNWNAVEFDGDHNAVLNSYVVDGVLTPRPHLVPTINGVSNVWPATVAADGASLLTITDLPPAGQLELVDPAGVRIAFAELAGDGTLELTFDLPGTYQLRIIAATHLPYELQINAT